VVRAVRTWTFGTERRRLRRLAGAFPAPRLWARWSCDVEGAFGALEQPGVWRHDGGVEPGEAAAEILLDKIVGTDGVVLPAVLEDVAERVLDLGRRLENAHVIPVGEYPPFPSEDAVDRTGEANRKGVQGAGERLAVRRLDDEVEVVALHAEVAEAAAERVAALVEGAANRPEQGGATRAREAAYEAIGHVDGEARRKLGATLVRDAATPGTRLATGLAPLSGPPLASAKRERELRRSPGIHDISLAAQ